MVYKIVSQNILPNFEMISEEYDQIYTFLSSNVYPTHFTNKHAKKNFRIKACQFEHGDKGKLFKAILDYFILL